MNVLHHKSIIRQVAYLRENSFPVQNCEFEQKFLQVFPEEVTSDPGLQNFLWRCFLGFLIRTSYSRSYRKNFLGKIFRNLARFQIVWRMD